MKSLVSFLSALLLTSLVCAQSVPNGGTITQGQVWTAPQWVTAWQSKADVASPAFTGTPTVNSIPIPFYPQAAGEVGAINLAYPPGNALRYGCDQSGIADSSNCLTNALNSNTYVYVPPAIPGAKYIVHDVTIPNGVTLNAYGAYFVDAVGANYVFKLTGFGAKLLGAYISSAANCATAAVVVDDGQTELVRDVVIVNSTSGIKMQSSSNGSNGFGNTKATIDNVQINAFSGAGLTLGPNVNNANIINVFADANTVAGGGGQIPKAGTTGIAITGTGSTVAFGGNDFINVVAINIQRGWVLTDANLDIFSNVVADSCSGPGITLAGTTNQNDFSNVFLGFCSIGIVESGTGAQNKFVGLHTNANGSIPSWGGTTYYSSAGSSTFLDIQQASTGNITVDLDNWQAFGTNEHTFSEAVAGSIQFTGGILIPFNSSGTVAAASTVFLGLNGQSATEASVQQPVPAGMFSIANAARVIILEDIAPGAGQTFTYTLRVNGASSALTCTATGSGIFQATCSGGPILISSLQSIDLMLATSASAGVAHHRGYIQLIPQPL